MGLDFDLAARRQTRVAGPAKAQCVRVPARGGPLGGMELAMHSYAATPVIDPVVPVAGGVYRLVDGVYVWDAERPSAAPGGADG